MSITTMAARPESPKLTLTRGKGPAVKASTLKTRQAHHARATQVVDTKLSSYDRTDPFMAFNVLLKVLGSLPSRMGGCQYKLTPEEHKLSLHLLNIVEPLLGSRRRAGPSPASLRKFSTPSRSTSTRRRTCSRSRCRASACTTSSFRGTWSIATSGCKVSSLSVWNHLMVHRSLARNVRRLEILDERAASSELLIPSDILNSDTDMDSTDDELGMHEKQERFLVGALGKMTSLHSFTWACNHSPISIDNVWPTLLKCHSLQEVDISDNLAFSKGGESTELESGSSTSSKARRQIVLPDLKSVAVRSTKHAYGSTKLPVLSRISGMLTHCPNLETLDIAYSQARNGSSPHPTADELLLYSRFPRLTSLTLTNLRCSIVDAPTTFLAAHTHLTHLRLDLGTSLRLTLPPNTLPHLRELHCNRDVATAVLSCPSDAPRPLETLKGVRLAGPPAPCAGASADQLFLASLRRYGTDVRRIELAGWSEMEDIRRLAESAPGLVWLDVGKKGQGQASRGPPLLAGLPELTTFHGVRFFYEVSATSSGATANLTMADRSRVRKNDEVAGVLAWKCVKLRRVDHWEQGGGKVVVLLRDGPGEKREVRWEVRRVKA
ncbi:hypothetical protein B0H14DRAFT_2906147 [Mycena olivaceomarginata]|nr:hypothetical protein B0H14DRAFT_2906147 [Mycena olivaceomarginata]